jgi:hypothetical protein
MVWLNKHDDRPGEPTAEELDHADGTVVDHKDITVRAPAPKRPGQRTRPWRHH